MTLLETTFWSLLGIIFYCYLGYGAIIIALAKLKSLFGRGHSASCAVYEPSVTLVVPAFNEEAWLKRKVENSLALDYPPEKLRLIVVTDGSDDGSVQILRDIPGATHLHEPERRGKMAAINRAMKFIDSEITVFSDANSMLNREAVREMVSLFRDPGTGCVSGEKRVGRSGKNEAAAAGEGTYWRYESRIKQGEAVLGSCLGAVGELFSVRTVLFRDGPECSLIDDFFISLGIALRGYKIKYTPKAWAVETASANIQEEFKRKTRIAAGNLQFLRQTPELLNPFRHGMLAFQYISHKFLRSFVAPLSFAVLIPLNIILLPDRWPLYALLLMAQALFYLVAAAGYFMQSRRLSSPWFFIPAYISLMNIAALAGTLLYLGGRQSVLWDKALRRLEDEPGGISGK